MTKHEVADRQRELNRWTKRWLTNVAPLRADGVWGIASRRRAMRVKYYLGYGRRDGSWNSPFVRKLRHTRNPRYSPPWQIALGIRRRLRQRRLAKAALRQSTSGVVLYDGRPCAAWMVPYMDWARHTGYKGERWHGVLVSGRRDPALSEHLCYGMCGAPSCPGRCAGRSSHHAQSVKPNGAIDVSDYETFGRLMAHCPFSPRIYNGLGVQDPVHFSATGN